MRRFSLFFFLFLLKIGISNGHAQDLSINASAAKVDIGGEKGDGFTSVIDFPLKYTKKEFWRFTRKLAKLKNLRTHYLLEIPPTSKQENASLRMHVSLLAVGDQTKMSSLLLTDGMTAEEIKKYKPLPENILREFQLTHHQQWLQDKIISLEKQSTKLNRRELKLTTKYSRIEKKNKNHPNLAALKAERQDARTELKLTLSQIEKYKAEFSRLK